MEVPQISPGAASQGQEPGTTVLERIADPLTGAVGILSGIAITNPSRMGNATVAQLAAAIASGQEKEIEQLRRDARRDRDTIAGLKEQIGIKDTRIAVIEEKLDAATSSKLVEYVVVFLSAFCLQYGFDQLKADPPNTQTGGVLIATGLVLFFVAVRFYVRGRKKA